MCVRLFLAFLIAAASFASLAGCTSAPKLSDLWTPNDAANPGTATQGNSETTGSIVTPPAEPGGSGEPVAPLAKPGLLGDDPNDDLQRGKRFFRANSFANAERSFRAAVESIRAMPKGGSAWQLRMIDCAASTSPTGPIKRR